MFYYKPKGPPTSYWKHRIYYFYSSLEKYFFFINNKKKFSWIDAREAKKEKIKKGDDDDDENSLFVCVKPRFCHARRGPASVKLLPPREPLIDIRDGAFWKIGKRGWMDGWDGWMAECTVSRIVKESDAYGRPITPRGARPSITPTVFSVRPFLFCLPCAERHPISAESVGAARALASFFRHLRFHHRRHEQLRQRPPAFLRQQQAGRRRRRVSTIHRPQKFQTSSASESARPRHLHPVRSFASSSIRRHHPAQLEEQPRTGSAGLGGPPQRPGTQSSQAGQHGIRRPPAAHPGAHRVRHRLRRIASFRLVVVVHLSGRKQQQKEQDEQSGDTPLRRRVHPQSRDAPRHRQRHHRPAANQRRALRIALVSSAGIGKHFAIHPQRPVGFLRFQLVLREPRPPSAAAAQQFRLSKRVGRMRRFQTGTAPILVLFPGAVLIVVDQSCRSYGRPGSAGHPKHVGSQSARVTKQLVVPESLKKKKNLMTHLLRRVHLLFSRIWSCAQ